MQKGFTLIELLVVIALIAVLAVAVVLSLNPAELLKQGRDSTRISDLSAIESALALYLVDVSTPMLTSSTNCYVYGTVTTTCAGRFSSGATNLVTSTSQAVDGSGWIPVNLTLMSSGSPLPRYPIDPTQSNPYFYAFRPSSTPGFYEINAQLESSKYLTRQQTDGGNNNNVYEVGNDLNL
mgnify:CR=1 FL=1